MIEIRFFADSGRGMVGMSILGHAGAGPRGADLICASATMLAYTAAQAVQELWEEGRLREWPMVFLKDGEARLCVCPRPEDHDRVAQVFRTVQCGARVLAHNFPHHVRLLECFAAQSAELTIEN